MYDAHVSPSGGGQIASPTPQSAIKVKTVMGVERAGNKVLLDDLYDVGVSEDFSGILASLSAFPLNKIGKDGLACFACLCKRCLNISAAPVFREVAIPNVTKLNWLALAQRGLSWNMEAAMLESRRNC